MKVSWRYRWRVNLKLKRGQWLTDVYQPTKLYINLTLNKLEEQDKPRADAIMSLHESDDYQPLLRAMANVPCIDVDTAKNILNMTIEQERQKVAPELTAAFENFMDMHSPQAVSAGMAYDGRNPGDDGDIDRILKTI